MKKFMKTCAILALVMIVAGFGMALVAGAIQGPISLSQLIRNIRLSDGGYVSLKEEIVSTLEELDSGVRFDIQDQLEFDSHNPALSGDVEQTFSADEVRDLDVEIGVCKFSFKDSEDADFHVKVKNAGSYQGYVKGDTLYIKAIRAVSENINDLSKCEIELFVPADFGFRDVELSVGAGQVQGDGPLKASELELELGAGEVSLGSLTVGKLDADVGMGSLDVTGDIWQEAEVDCAMGDVKLTVSGARTDFNYEIEVAAGSVSIDDQVYGGMANKKDIKNGAAKDISVDCGMGSVAINFTE